MTRRRGAGLIAAVLLSALVPAAAGAQVIFTVPAAPPGGAAPLVNASVRTQTSPVYLQVANNVAATTLSQLVFELPTGVKASGGAGPPGWTVTDVNNQGQGQGQNRFFVTFRVATCGQGGLATGQSGLFRLDVSEPTAGTNTTAILRSVAASDPCGATGPFTVGALPSLPFRSLGMTAAAAVAGGPTPLSTSVTTTVTNDSGASRTVSVATPTVTPATGASAGACTPASAVLAAGASATFTCPVTLTAAAPTVFTVAANASAGAAVSGIGATAQLVVAAATAAFALDATSAAPAQLVRATLQVTNRHGAPISVTPPGYSALGLTALTPAAGAADPLPVASLAPGATASFAYDLAVTGSAGVAYAASAAAVTSVGPTNVATTPAAAVSGWKVTWTPSAVVTARTAAPYGFGVSVTNGTGGPMTRIDLVNPQNATWTGMANVGATGLACASPAVAGTTTTISCTGSLAAAATATMNVSFTGVGPAGAYPFQVVVYGFSVPPQPMYTATRTVTVRTAVDFDVADLTIGSTAAGNTLRWTNRSTPSGTHDGVVIFRTAAPAVPQLPADFVEYAAGAGQVVYADRYSSPVASFVDATPGAYNYRVCNHDAGFVYSNCSSGFWNGAGWLDSAAAPAGGWTHQVGTGVFLAPGVIPGASLLGVATNVPSVVSLATGTGARTLAPVALSSPPSSGTPAAPLGNGLEGLFAADTGGGVTAVDLATGAVAWSAPKAGESFVAGVTGALASMLPAAYGTDVLFLGSTTGRLLALDARTGATLWTLTTGASAIRALATYDFGASSWRLHVATDGGGILAYDLAASTPAVAPVPLAGWTNPGGAYTLGCVVLGTASLACVDAAGVVRILDKATGELTASYPTGLASPTSLWLAPSGLVVSNASQVARLTVAGPAVTLVGTYAPGLTLSRPQVFGGDGFLYVGASDLRIHKLALPTLAPLGVSAPLPSQAAGALLGQPAYDVVGDRLLVGVSDGRIWALPKF